MTMRIEFLVLLVLISSTTTVAGQEKYDDSLKNACEVMGGQFEPRESVKSVTGDKCSLKFKVSTRDDDDARDFCELNAPWRVIKVHRTVEADRHFTWCQVEATLMCAKGWVQMFGHCFKMPNKVLIASREEAENMCRQAHPKGEIAFMHHKYIVGVWKNYFRGIRQIWVRASETWDHLIQKTNTVDGDSLALAFFGKHYDFSVFYNSLIKIDPNILLQVLCEYKPSITNAEINYLGKRYSEIYYPTVPVHNGILVRSASSYTSSTNVMDVCKKTLLPYKVDVVGPFVPESEVLSEMSQIEFPFMYLTRSGAEARLHQSQQEKLGCQHVASRFLVKVEDSSISDYYLKDFHDPITCDNMKSVGISHLDKNAKLVVMSDSRSVPVWCKLGLPLKISYDTPPGYTLFQRDNGDAVAHRYYPEKKTYDEASAFCKSQQALLSGINELKEAQMLGRLAQGCVTCQPWLGGIRKQECRDKSFVAGTTDPCARNNIIQWQDNVANEFFDDWWRDGKRGLKNPDSSGKHQQNCLTYVVGTPHWADKDTTRFLDDIECWQSHDFFCMKHVEVTKEDV